MHQQLCLARRNDPSRAVRYYGVMATPTHDWYLREWLRTLKKKQADIVRDLDWNKARISLMIRGEQPYTRDAINELAAYLSLHPYELLMHPDEAMALRRLRQEAMRVVDTSEQLARSTELDKRDGTNG